MLEINNSSMPIKAKNSCSTLDHSGEVPSELATTATPAPKSPPKKTKAGTGRVVEPFNQEIKTLSEQPRRDAGYPRFTVMCEFFGHRANQQGLPPILLNRQLHVWRGMQASPQKGNNNTGQGNSSISHAQAYQSTTERTTAQGHCDEIRAKPA